MTKRFVSTLFLLFLLLSAVFGIWGFNVYQQMQKFADFQPPPVAVGITQSKNVVWSQSLATIGTLEATRGVNIQPETSGIVKEIPVKSGQLVRAGQILFQLNNKLELAELKNAKAELKLAALSYARIKNLVGKKAAASSELDKASAQLQQAQAKVDRASAQIEQKTIRAPFDGKLGLINVDPGQLVSPQNTSNMVSLQSLNPLNVNFTFPEKYLTPLQKAKTLSIKVAGFENKVFKGTVSAIDSQVDLQTHNITVQGTVDNTNLDLYPGLFAEVKVDVPQQDSVIVIPKVAVTYSLHGDMVYIIAREGDKLVAKRRFVTVGKEQNNLVAISNGLANNETVVTTGHQKLRDNTRVIIDEKASL